MRMAGVIHGPRVFGNPRGSGTDPGREAGRDRGPVSRGEGGAPEDRALAPHRQRQAPQVDVPLLDNPNAAQQYRRLPGAPGAPGGANSGGGPGGFPGGAFPGAPGFTPGNG